MREQMLVWQRRTIKSLPRTFANLPVLIDSLYNLHEGLHGQWPTCAGRAEPGSHSSPAAVRTAWPPARSPTRHAPVSTQRKTFSYSRLNILSLVYTETTSTTAIQHPKLVRVWWNGTSSPVRTDLDVMEDDATSPLVLEGQQLVSVLPLLITVLLEEMGEAWKGHVITGEVKGLWGTGRWRQLLGEVTHNYLAKQKVTNTSYAARQWSNTRWVMTSSQFKHR